MPLLALDVGNTRLKWALFVGGAMRDHGALILEEISTLNATQWKALPAPDRIIVSNVAGDAVRHRVEDQLSRWDVEPEWIVSQAAECGVVNGYEHPSRLGVDRWVALIGARHRILARGAPRPILVVMVGTAVTVDALDAEGRFLGGLILPGFGLMLRALEMGTAGLKAPTGESVDFPTNTSDALMSGGADAIAGAVERMHRKLLKRCGQEPALLMSGGAAVKLASISDLRFETIETLIFEGLLQLQAKKLAL